MGAKLLGLGAGAKKKSEGGKCEQMEKCHWRPAKVCKKVPQQKCHYEPHETCTKVINIYLSYTRLTLNI